MGAPDFLGWSRFTFAQGVMTYVVPILWFIFIPASIYATASRPPEPQGFVNPDVTGDATISSVVLILGIVSLLVLPKMLIVVSSILAPITLAFQLRSILQVLSGSDGGWPATERDASEMKMDEALAASYWIPIMGLLNMFASWSFTPALLFWILPITLPMILAPVLIWLTSKHVSRAILVTPLEQVVPPVVSAYREIYGQWVETAQIEEPEQMARLV